MHDPPIFAICLLWHRPDNGDFGRRVDDQRGGLWSELHALASDDFCRNFALFDRPTGQRGLSTSAIAHGKDILLSAALHAIDLYTAARSIDLNTCCIQMKP